MNNQKIEINADMGEGFDLYTQEHTSALMPYITMVLQLVHIQVIPTNWVLDVCQ